VFIILAAVLMALYFRTLKMSLAAVLALVHDLVITAGVYGALGFEDLSAALVPRVCLAQPEALQAAFRALDADGDGVIGVEDIAATLRARARVRRPVPAGGQGAPATAPSPWRASPLCQGGGGVEEPEGDDGALLFAAAVVDEALGLCGGGRGGGVRFAEFVRVVAPPRDDIECAQ
jgi:hypothetical protein